MDGVGIVGTKGRRLKRLMGPGSTRTVDGTSVHMCYLLVSGGFTITWQRLTLVYYWHPRSLSNEPVQGCLLSLTWCTAGFRIKPSNFVLCAISGVPFWDQVLMTRVCIGGFLTLRDGTGDRKASPMELVTGMSSKEAAGTIEGTRDQAKGRESCICGRIS